MAKKFGAFTDGRDILVDVDQMKQDIKTRKDIKHFTALSGDAYDLFLGKYTGLTLEEIDALEIEDFKALDRAVGEALKTFIRPN